MSKSVTRAKTGFLAYLAWFFIVVWFIIYWFDLLKPLTINLSATKTTLLDSTLVLLAFIISLISRNYEGKGLINLLALLISIVLLLFSLFTLFLVNVIIN